MAKTKTKKRQSAKLVTTHQPPAPSAISHAGEPWPPDMLLDRAKQEPNRRPLGEYFDVIKMLRDEKKFTFREIAEWLKDYNVEADHNAVYREYTKGMPDDVAHDEALADEHIEKEESGH